MHPVWFNTTWGSLRSLSLLLESLFFLLKQNRSHQFHCAVLNFIRQLSKHSKKLFFTM